MGEEGPRFAGTLSGKAVSVADAQGGAELRGDGYGEEAGGSQALAMHEALYLVYRGALEVRRGRRVVGFEELMRSARRRDAGALERFLVYRDLRARGYTVRNGFGFGVDFCVYGRGDYGKKGARHLVFGFSDGARETAGALQEKVAEMIRMGKEPIVAVIDGRGEVIYYKVAPATFPENSARKGASLKGDGPRRRVL